MHSNTQDQRMETNTKLILQVAEYYRSTKTNLAIYQEMEIPTLEALASKHLLHWKQELRRLVLNGINCTDKRSHQ